MNYETAAVLCHDGTDDYSLWVVDLPEPFLSGVKQTGHVIRGNLEAVMDQIPKTDDSNGILHFLFQEDGGFVVRAKEVDYSFWDKHQNEGWSVHGETRVIRDKILEYSQAQSVSPEISIRQEV